jgi:molybdopterin converting factor small subunit
MSERAVSHRFRVDRREVALPTERLCHNRQMRLLRMKPGHGEVLLAEGDVEVGEELEALVAEFRAQVDAGMWAAVPLTVGGGRREAQLVRTFDEVPREADRVIFFPRAAGGR